MGTYVQDGVDIHKEAEFSSLAGDVCVASYKNSQFVKVHDFAEGNFRGPRPFSLKNLPKDVFIEMSSDGIGTKGILIDAAQSYNTVAYDLLAMVTSDITRYGGIPLVVNNVLDILTLNKNNTQAYTQLLNGLGQATKDAGLVALKGETAQMPQCISSEIENSSTQFNWSATVVGAYTKDKIITGKTVRPGHIVIALTEHGFRCNGISAVRSAFKKKFGANWWENTEAKDAIKLAAAPSILYDKYINTLHGWYNSDFKPEVTLHAVAHISGGGIVEKFGRDILSRHNLSAILDTLPALPDIMKSATNWHNLSDKEMYTTWNGGVGMLLVIDESDVDYCIARAKDFGIKAQVAGKVTDTTTNNPTLTLHSILSDMKLRYVLNK